MGSTAEPLPTTTTTTAGPVRIRKARPSDASAVATLGAAVFSSTFENSGCTPEQLQQYLSESYTPDAIAKDIADPDKELLVAVDRPTPTPTPTPNPGPASGDSDPGLDHPDGTILGFTLMTRGSHLHEPSVRHLEAPVELQRLYVGLGQHGRGVGRALAEAVVEMAREEGFKHMWLGVWEENHRAQKIYGKMGFVRIGEHVFDVGGDLQTDHIMFKAL
ncbi:Spermidine/spermine N(1)-acetyltransferase [Cytospora mali]|uniref:Spermidine/spermine N(1)-acetyltransferase n=1 Tax=Cytospora mali TaxID=578113 RepID=A0A194W1X4_CYTMA|nr:Spermidine/spermine N(1)-acetyltransferase [Valsa mali]